MIFLSWRVSLSLRKQRFWHFLWMCIVAHHTSLSGMLNEDNYCAQPHELLQKLKEIVLLNPYTILKQSEWRTQDNFSNTGKSINIILFCENGGLEWLETESHGQLLRAEMGCKLDISNPTARVLNQYRPVQVFPFLRCIRVLLALLMDGHFSGDVEEKWEKISLNKDHCCTSSPSLIHLLLPI